MLGTCLPFQLCLLLYAFLVTILQYFLLECQVRHFPPQPWLPPFTCAFKYDNPLSNLNFNICSFTVSSLAAISHLHILEVTPYYHFTLCFPPWI